jgi:hypothetical protein
MGDVGEHAVGDVEGACAAEGCEELFVDPAGVAYSSASVLKSFGWIPRSVPNRAPKTAAT